MDFTAVYVANMLGLILLATVLLCNSWRIHDRSRENLLLLCFIAVGFISCLADPFACYFDGRAGAAAHLIVCVSNNWLYLANIIASAAWVMFIAEHIGHRISRKHAIAILLSVILAVAVLVVNAFCPIAYSLDASNTYTRKVGYYYFLLLVLIYLIDGLVIYINARRRGGVLKFFPVWAYAIPIVIGALIQAFYYGVSIVWPCVAIAIAGVIASLQNELMFRDKLTGLYNRFYLDNIKDILHSSRDSRIGAMMIDLNGFKTINDTLGHSVGDEALKDAAKVMSGVIGTMGSVVRYAGDEFVILTNTQSQDDMDGIVDAIKEGFYEFNEASKKPYKLSVSVGAGIFDLREQGIDEVMNEIDMRMYRSKRTYYMSHDRRRSQKLEEEAAL